MKQKTGKTTTSNILWNWIVILLTVLALLWRYGNVIFPPRLLAEDGIIFTKAAYEHGLTSIFRPYAGYFHVLSRSVAYLSVEVFPIDMLPTTFLLASMCIFLYVAYKYLATETLNRSTRIIAILSLLLLPGSGQDYLNLTNSHWFTSALYPLVLLAPTLHSRSQTIGRCILLAIIGMNDPLIIAAFPFFVFRKWRNTGNTYETMLFFVASGVFIAQGCCIVLSPQPHWLHPVPCPREELLKFWVLAGIMQPIGIFVIGEAISKNALHSIPTFCLCSAGIVAFLSIWLFAFLKATRQAKEKSAIFFLLAIAFYASSMYRNLFSPQEIVADGISRYFFVPYVFLAVSIAICLSELHGVVGRAVFGLETICIFLSPLKDFKIPPRYCADWKNCMQELNDNGQVTIRIAPDDSWSLHLDKHSTK